MSWEIEMMYSKAMAKLRKLNTTVATTGHDGGVGEGWGKFAMCGILWQEQGSWGGGGEGGRGVGQTVVDVSVVGDGHDFAWSGG